ncbi:MAG: DUF2280 domain-containing protein [Capsulimonas sp.]|uniref:DUF2280 domain-containing protein n=1 Tax=Capsulimonas sp. TaxID=2494211 RepID=UPI003266985B
MAEPPKRGRPRKTASAVAVKVPAKSAPKSKAAANPAPEAIAAPKPSRALPNEILLYIIERLAQWAGPSEIQKEIAELWDGRDVAKSTINRYNPHTAQGDKELPDDLKALFAERRRLFVERVDDIPIAHQAVRLRELQSVVDQSKEAGNKGMLMQAIEQAAKERGGMFTNRRELTGKDGGPVSFVNETPPPELAVLSDEELAALESINAKIFHGGDAEPGAAE